MTSKKNLKIIIAGDLLPWTNNIEQFKAGDASCLFSSEVCQLFSSADFSIINLEGPLTDCQEKQIKIGPVIKAEKEAVNGLKALGVKAVAMANNHVTDYGIQGILDTFEILDVHGIGHVGAGRNIHDINTHLSFGDGGRSFCIYNVSEAFFNVPDENNPGVNLYDEYVVCNEIRDLKKQHDYVIVIYHGGAEYFQYPTPQTRRRFHRMADSGADLITAQHTHCIGCEEWYNGSYLLYGQGNFLFSKQTTRPMTKEGLVLEVMIDDTLNVKKHRVELNENACIKYSDNQTLFDFYERSNDINDEEKIKQRFCELKPDRIIESYLLAYKGNSFVIRRFKKLIPKFIWKKILRSYSSNQIMRNQFTLTSDRANEDVHYMWKKIMNENT